MLPVSDRVCCGSCAQQNCATKGFSLPANVVSDPGLGFASFWRMAISLCGEMRRKFHKSKCHAKGDGGKLRFRSRSAKPTPLPR